MGTLGLSAGIHVHSNFHWERGGVLTVSNPLHSPWNIEKRVVFMSPFPWNCMKGYYMLITKSTSAYSYLCGTSILVSAHTLHQHEPHPHLWILKSFDMITCIAMTLQYIRIKDIVFCCPCFWKKRGWNQHWNLRHL